EIGARGGKCRSVDASRGERRERTLERLLAVADHDDALEVQYAAAPREANRDPAAGAVGARQPLAAAARLAQGDHRRGGVLADVLAARTVAVPVRRVELEVNRRRDQAAARRDAQHHRLLVLALAAHRTRARELHATRPDRRRARAADRREQRVELL